MATLNDIGGLSAADRACEAYTEERLRRIRRWEASQDWLPRFGDFTKNNGESGFACDKRLVKRIIEVWLPAVEARGGLIAGFVFEDVVNLAERLR